MIRGTINDLQADLAAAEAELQRIGDSATAPDRAAARTSGRMLRNAHASTDRALTRYTEQSRRVAQIEQRLTRAELAQADAERVRLTADDVKGARYVRTSAGWHKVARVNKTTVSVETGYSWVDRYSFDKILEVRV